MKSLSIFVFIVWSSFVLAPEKGYEVGDVVDSFTLRNIDGKNVGLNDYSGQKGVIVVFTCNTCPVAKAYEQRILGLDKKYKTKGYPVVAINPNDVGQSPGDSYDEMKKRAGQKRYTFPYLIDEDQSVTKKFGATRTPHIYVLGNKDGNYTVQYIGAIDNNQNGEPDTRYVEDAVESLLAGKKPSVPFTKAVGCGIKFKNI